MIRTVRGKRGGERKKGRGEGVSQAGGTREREGMVERERKRLTKLVPVEKKRLAASSVFESMYRTATTLSPSVTQKFMSERSSAPTAWVKVLRALIV